MYFRNCMLLSSNNKYKCLITQKHYTLTNFFIEQCNPLLFALIRRIFSAAIAKTNKIYDKSNNYHLGVSTGITVPQYCCDGTLRKRANVVEINRIWCQYCFCCKMIGYKLKERQGSSIMYLLFQNNSMHERVKKFSLHVSPVLLVIHV